MSEYVLVDRSGIEIGVIGKRRWMTEAHDKEKVVQGVATGRRQRI